MFSRARIGSFVLLVAGIVMLGAASAQAQGQTVQANFNVTASVARSCTVSANSLVFGAYDSFTQALVDGTTTLDLRCTRSIATTINLSDGGNPNNGIRRMSAGPSAFLVYDLYADQNHSQRWGSNAQAVAWTAPNSGVNTLTVYGRIASGQDAAPGSYSDTIQVTVNY